MHVNEMLHVETKAREQRAHTKMQSCTSLCRTANLKLRPAYQIDRRDGRACTIALTSDFIENASSVWSYSAMYIYEAIFLVSLASVALHQAN